MSQCVIGAAPSLPLDPGRAGVGRLAPTPSGHLHLGNVLAFGAAWLSARAAGARLLLRVEDVDLGRARPGIAESQRTDLRWLGLGWDEEVAPQSTRDYAPWIERLGDRVYRCTCTRRELAARDGRCDCPDRDHDQGAARFRLRPGPVRFADRRFGPVTVDATRFGDPTLQRRDGVYAYNLAVVVDDLEDGVTEVVRGADLLEYTAVQLQLWEALGAPAPTWMHAPLILGPDGRKLSKSHGAAEVRALRDRGVKPAGIWRGVLPWLGIEGCDRLEDAVDRFDPQRGPRGPITVADPASFPG